MTLVNRLNKRVKLLRLPKLGEWMSTAGNEGSFGYEGERTYQGSDPAYVYWNDWLIPAENRDEYGQPFDELFEIGTLWAAVEPLRGREYFSAMTEHADVTTRIRIRYREGIDRTMIVRFGDTEFEILHIIRPEFGKKELQLMCKERQ